MIGKKLLILAGGFGTRLRSVVSQVPKPLAPVNRKPFLYYLIESWKKQAVSDYVFLLHHQPELMIDFIQSIKTELLEDSKISWTIEPEPLGTGGSIAYAVEQLSIDKPFMVANADTWLSAGISELASSNPNSILIVRVDNTTRYGKVEIQGNIITNFLEKKDSEGSGWINAGVYHLHPSLFKNWDGKPFSIEQKIFPELANNKELYAVKLDTDFIDIGIPEDYLRFQSWIVSKKKEKL